MSVTDPIADLLTRIRNASNARKIRVTVPASQMKIGIVEILKNNGYIHDYKIEEDSKQNTITIVLKYTNGKAAINGLKKISKPGLRIYKKSTELPRVLNGLGTAVISTSKGLLTDREASRQSAGGEVICYIW